MKRLLLFSLGLLLLCFPLAGCDSEDSLDSGEIETIFEGVSENWEPDSCTLDMEMSVVMNTGSDLISFSPSVEAKDGQGAIDFNNQELWIQIPVTFDTGIEAVDGERTIEVFIVDGWVYTNISGEWTKMELPLDMLGELIQSITIGQLVDLLNLEEIDNKGSEEVNDVDCYKFQITPDIEQLAEDALQQLGLEAFDFSDLEEIISSLELDCTFWIAKEGNQVIKARLDLSGELSSEDIPDDMNLGIEGLGSIGNYGSMDVSMWAEIVFEDASIPDLPSEALAAEQGDMALPFF